MEHKVFKPYDKVLIRVDSDDVWENDFYAYFIDEINAHVTISYQRGIPIKDEDILPYEGNEYLLGTTDEPEEEVKLEKGEWLMLSSKPSNLPYNWTLKAFFDIQNSTNSFLATASDNIPYRWDYCIKFSKFNPNDMEETKKHILCIKDGKIVRYKK